MCEEIQLMGKHGLIRTTRVSPDQHFELRWLPRCCKKIKSRSVWLRELSESTVLQREWGSYSAEDWVDYIRHMAPPVGLNSSSLQSTLSSLSLDRSSTRTTEKRCLMRAEWSHLTWKRMLIENFPTEHSFFFYPVWKGRYKRVEETNIVGWKRSFMKYRWMMNERIKHN